MCTDKCITARNHLEETMEKMETERQELLNENIRITEESHNLVCNVVCSQSI